MQVRGSAAVVALVTGLALGGCEDGRDAAARNDTLAAAASNLAEAKLASTWNGSWITLSGRVVGTAADSFVLDYGTGRITVEMDDWDFYHEGRALLPGDQVTVTGRIDRDFAERKKIEAASVYVGSLGTSFTANPGDEEDFASVIVAVPAAPGFTGISGTVSNIEGRRFTLGEPNANILVDTSSMAENPLDATGKFRVKPGDRVQVWGRMTVAPNQPVALIAEGIIIQAKDAMKKAPKPAPGEAAGSATAQEGGGGNAEPDSSNSSGPRGL
jgi:uncharacterized protein YdeI (BOF family)